MVGYSAEQLIRLQRTLRRRFRVAARPDLLEIGFGHVPLDRSSTGRPRLTCVFFTTDGQTGSSQSPSRRLPDEVTARVRDGRRYRTVRLPTRRVVAGGLEPSAASAEFSGTRFTLSAVISWRRTERRRREWGLLTVGHPFPALQRIPAWQRLVEVRGERPFYGTLILRSRRGGRFDGAVIRTARDELAAAGLVPEHGHIGYRTARPLEQLGKDMGRSAELTVPGKHSRSFQVQAFLPRMTIPGVGSLHYVLAGSAPRSKTFAPGTSGAGWQIEGQPACFQIAAVAPRYRIGFGQAVTSLLVWAETRLRRHHPDLVPGSIRLAPIPPA